MSYGDLSRGPYLDLIAHLQYPLGKRTAQYAPDKILRKRTRFVHVKGSCHMHSRSFILFEIGGQYNFFDHVDQNIDIDVVMCGDGNDGCAFGNGALYEFRDLPVILPYLFLGNQIYLVLNDDNILNLGDLESHEMFLGLGLGARFIRRYQ